MPDLSELTSQARSLIEDLDPTRALVTLDAATPPAPPADAELLLLRVAALAALEQFHDAFGLLATLLERRELDQSVRVEAQLHKARVLRKASLQVDEALETAL